MITKQGKDSSNYQELLRLVKEKSIKLSYVKMGDKLKVDKEVFIQILWPQERLLQENILNNNSMVCKVQYHSFSMLFTGDIEELAEKEILQVYKDTTILRATVLKIAHHGSKSSSTLPFLEAVKPQIALMGVGENNTFGHPSIGTIQRLQTMQTQIYRTDKQGEIQIRINRNGKIEVYEKIK